MMKTTKLLSKNISVHLKAIRNEPVSFWLVLLLACEGECCSLMFYSNWAKTKSKAHQQALCNTRQHNDLASSL